MRILIIGLTLLFFLFAPALAGQNVEQSAKPFVVIELFASEGCSSCPPADALLSALTRVARTQGQRIFTLSFEVDYWNRLGWVDPFSQPQFTQRQGQYADILGNSSVYTPQMVINGQQGFVGSNADLAKKYIDQYSLAPSSVAINLSLDPAAEGKIKIKYHCSQTPDDTVIHFALVQRGVESHPNAGENEGRTLKHDNVVREFKTVPLKQAKGEIFISQPSAKDDLNQFSITAYVQNGSNMRILGAESIDLGK